MTTYNTGNPIGSTDARDRLDNSENMDILENSTTLNAHPDRLGVMRKTRKGMELEHDNQISAHESEHDAQIAAHEAEFTDRIFKMAFTPVGTFTDGATLTDARQTLLWEVSEGGDGHYYSWAGSFGTSGKAVTAGSSPSPIAAGSWVDRTDDSLRYEIRETVFQNMKRLAAEAGFNLVDGSFEEGAVISGWPDVVWSQTDGKYYQWYLDEAKTIAAGSTPATSGGIGAGAWVDKTNVTLRSSVAEVGKISVFASRSAPPGYLKCNGAEISRTTYSALFAAIGTTFGLGDGSTTFNVPDLRGEFIRGWDDARGIDTSRVFGSWQDGQNKSHAHTGTTSSDTHTHTWSGTTSSEAHTHTLTIYQGSGAISGKAGPANSTNNNGSAQTSSDSHTHTVSGTTSSGAHTHTMTTEASGGTEVRVRNVAMNYCIKY